MKRIARMMGVEICTTPHYRPESFIKTFKRDYVHMNPLPDAQTVLEKGSLDGSRITQALPPQGAKNAVTQAVQAKPN